MPKPRAIRPLYSKKPNKNVYKYWDPKTGKHTKVSGFQLDLWDSQSQTRIRKVIKADLEAAKAAYDQLEGLIQDANVSVPTLIKRSKVRTLGDLYRKYEKASKSDAPQERRRKRSPLTVKRKGYAVRTFQTTLGRDPELKSLRPAAIERFIQIRIDGGYKEGGINTDLRSLKALFNWALKRDLITANPFAKIDMFPVERDEPRPLSPTELKRLFHHNPPGSRWYPLLMTYLLTGARLSEILKPKFSWSDIDFENETFTLPMRKGRKSTEFPLDQVLLEIFRDLKRRPIYKDIRHRKADDQDYPFPFNAHFISHKVKALLEAAGITATAHDLRDSFVSHLIDLGYPIEEVSKLAGHTNTKITEQYYYGLIEGKRRQMLADLGRHIVTVSTGETISTPVKIVTETDDIDRPSMTDADLFFEMVEEAEKAASRRKKRPLEGDSGGTRTHGQWLKRPLLYHLSYRVAVRHVGLEPTTFGLRGRCSTN